MEKAIVNQRTQIRVNIEFSVKDIKREDLIDRLNLIRMYLEQSPIKSFETAHIISLIKRAVISRDSLDSFVIDTTDEESKVAKFNFEFINSDITQLGSLCIERVENGKGTRVYFNDYETNKKNNVKIIFDHSTNEYKFASILDYVLEKIGELKNVTVESDSYFESFEMMHNRAIEKLEEIEKK